VVAPMPMASEKMAAKAKPGLLMRARAELARAYVTRRHREQGHQRVVEQLLRHLFGERLVGRPHRLQPHHDRVSPVDLGAPNATSRKNQRAPHARARLERKSLPRTDAPPHAIACGPDTSHLPSAGTFVAARTTSPNAASPERSLMSGSSRTQVGARTLVVVLAVSLAVPCPLTAGGKPPERPWSNVTKLEQGRQITVQPFEGKTVAGKFVSADDAAISIKTKKEVVTVRRQDIRWIKKASKPAAVGGMMLAGGSLIQLIQNLRGLAKKREGVVVQVGMLPTTVAVGGGVLALCTLPKKIYEAPPDATPRQD